MTLRSRMLLLWAGLTSLGAGSVVMGCARPEAPLSRSTQVEASLAGLAAPVQAPDAAPIEPALLRPVELVVPAALRLRSRFEPSGLVWIPELDRYLLVSDDTGLDGRDERAPWLFTMDRAGIVDPEPLVVVGLEGVDDLESIARTHDGAIYVLASQSASKSGKRRAERRQFLRLALRDGSLHLDGRLLLFDRLRDAPPGLRAALRVDLELESLDIEGMAADGDGLLLGLKAPAALASGTPLWTLPNPVAAFAAPALQPADLALLGMASLAVVADGRRVAGGVADLLVLPDGSLLVAATASGIDPAHQEGVIVRLRRPLDASPPELLHRFPGDKPEGLAISAEPGRFVAVFDRGAAPPAWITLPLPTGSSEPASGTAPGSVR